MDGYDKQQIGELLARAAHALDHRDNGVLAACFHPEAVFRLEITGNPANEFEGIEAIMGLITGAQDAQTNVRRHAITNLWYPETGEREATVVSYVTLCGTENGATEVITTGVYTDRVEKAGIDGGWRIKHRSLVLDNAF